MHVFRATPKPRCPSECSTPDRDSTRRDTATTCRVVAPRQAHRHRDTVGPAMRPRGAMLDQRACAVTSSKRNVDKAYQFDLHRIAHHNTLRSPSRCLVKTRCIKLYIKHHTSLHQDPKTVLLHKPVIRDAATHIERLCSDDLLRCLATCKAWPGLEIAGAESAAIAAPVALTAHSRGQKLVALAHST